ncbi:hypothetical protein H6P81_006967 [Aristolochia fimbriata]|uniref:Uncharacterized protein n=1 Tax=Aristolochia fimbriata TaxID=158543 RepID=A0AAV7EZ63_ARIFI|nr:hypothetical protein H6P81_006967 [Aristolochia fimbriata]
MEGVKNSLQTDYTLRVTSKKDQEQSWVDKSKPYQYILVSESSTPFKRIFPALWQLIRMSQRLWTSVQRELRLCNISICVLSPIVLLYVFLVPSAADCIVPYWWHRGFQPLGSVYYHQRAETVSNRLIYQRAETVGDEFLYPWASTVGIKDLILPVQARGQLVLLYPWASIVGNITIFT